MVSIEFYFDCSSPWTYLGFERVQPLAEESGAELEWKPILVAWREPFLHTQRSVGAVRACGCVRRTRDDQLGGHGA